MYHDPNELLSIEELCETLSIGRNAAYRLLGDGSIPAFRIGRIWKIPKVGVERYILKQSRLE